MAKPKEVLTVEENVQNIEHSTAHLIHNLTASDWVDDYSQCGLCGSPLQFEHITNFITLEVIEEAKCPSCKIRNRRDLHRLQ